MTLVDRVAAAVARHSAVTGLGYSRTRCGCGEVFSAPFVKSHATHVAEQIAEAMPAIPRGHEIPDRQFVDDQGRRWEWCGGEPETWAWRVTARAAAEVKP